MQGMTQLELKRSTSAKRTSKPDEEGRWHRQRPKRLKLKVDQRNQPEADMLKEMNKIKAKYEQIAKDKPMPLLAA